jgi:hypothetical protein
MVMEFVLMAAGLLGIPNYPKEGTVKKYLLAATIAAGLIAPVAAATTLFNSEQEAQHHCPKDTVVWLNLKTGIYHWKGQVWYGNTNSGAFVCQKEADANGARATHGQ